MKTLILALFNLFLFIAYTWSQNLSQTVRGSLIDTDSKLSLIGATILVPGSAPLIGTITDANGNFRLDNIPIGRITLQISYLGYESKIIPNIVVDLGKEVVLNLSMQGS